MFDLITRQRDRARLDVLLVNALHELATANGTRLYKLMHTRVEPLAGLAVCLEGERLRQYDDGISRPAESLPVSAIGHLADCLAQRRCHCARDPATGAWHHVFLIGQDRTQPAGLVELSSSAPFSHEMQAILSALIRVYENCNALLDYCEVDTLTGLLNRKTFDEYLFKMLSRRGGTADGPKQAAGMPQRRQLATGGNSHWIGVLDIDHFKRINDGYGHAIGDEVLLMLANRMKTHFRAEDRLFRFGGEEFVLLLKPTATANAQTAFERFRLTVEQQDFPQVGRVTVSIGYARIGAADEASMALENADRALYWGKENGRNRVCSYESLVESGHLQPQAAMNSEVELF